MARAPRRAVLEASAPLFAALGDESRLAIVHRLCSYGPASLTQLSDGAGITRQAVTKHLHVLDGAGLVRSMRQGRERIWELEPKKLEDGRRALDVISREWDAALARLRAFVEE